MAHEILSVKLSELEQRLGRVYSRIRLTETAGHDEVRMQKAALQQECAENDLALLNKLKYSRSRIVSEFCNSYGELNDVVTQIKKDLDIAPLPDDPSDIGTDELTESTEEKILLAEYALDFAMQAADHALCMALDALDTQMTLEEREELMK